MTSSASTDHQRFVEHIPAHLNSELPAADAAWMQAQAAAHPEWLQDVQWADQLRHTLRAEAAAEPLADGWAQLQARLHTAPATPHRAPPAPAAPSAWQRWWRDATGWLAQPAGALATVLIVGQASWIAWQATAPAPADLAWRGTTAEALAEAPARIAFTLAANAPPTVLQAVLADQPQWHLSLTGPGAWVLEVPAADAAAALARLQAHPDAITGAAVQR